MATDQPVLYFPVNDNPQLMLRNYTLFTPTVILIPGNFLHLCKQ